MNPSPSQSPGFGNIVQVRVYIVVEERRLIFTESTIHRPGLVFPALAYGEDQTIRNITESPLTTPNDGTTRAVAQRMSQC